MATKTETFATLPKSENESGSEKIVLSYTDQLVKLVNNAIHSDEYATLRSNRIPPAEAMSQAMTAIAEDENNNLTNFESSLLSVTAGLGTFLEAQDELEVLSAERLRLGRLPDDEFNRTKELKNLYIIPFNHNLKSLINEAPNNLPKDTLVNGLSRAHASIFSHYNMLHPGEEKDPTTVLTQSDTIVRLDSIVNGMRHEIAAETMLIAAGINYDYDISVAEDARGIDIILEIDGKKTSIDVKSSNRAAQNARDKYPWGRAVYTGLTDDDFKGINDVEDPSPGALITSYATAEKNAPAFIDRIRKAINASNVYEANRARTIGTTATHSW